MKCAAVALEPSGAEDGVHSMLGRVYMGSGGTRARAHAMSE